MGQTVAKRFGPDVWSIDIPMGTPPWDICKTINDLIIAEGLLGRAWWSIRLLQMPVGTMYFGVSDDDPKVYEIRVIYTPSISRFRLYRGRYLGEAILIAATYVSQQRDALQKLT